MSEGVKRVPTQSLESAGSLGNATKEKKREKGKQLAPSIRLELCLDDKNETAYAEFNYTQLLKSAEKKRSKENKNTNGLDPFDDDDDEKERIIARKFEAKYGTSNVMKKNKKKYDDDVDLGAGYDENDSFIDNTDAYDEIVPLGVTTAHGGFYINWGKLEFAVKEGEVSLARTLNHTNNESSSSESSDDDEDSNSPPPKRRDSRLASSSEEDDEEIVEPAPKKSKLDENGEKKVNYDNMIKKKKKLTEESTVDSLNKQKNTDDKRDHMEVDISSDTNQEQRKKLSCDVIKTKDVAKKISKKPVTNGLDDNKKLDNGKKLTVKDSNVDNAIESVVNDGKADDDDSRDTVDSNKSRSVVAGTSSEGEDGDKSDCRMPDNLPEDVKEIINKLKKHVENNNKDGKIKFFDAYANSAILNLDTKLRQMDSPAVRNQVYTNLAPLMSCSKNTLSNRIKKLSLQEAENKVREPMERLKAIIEQLMPAAVSKFEEECRRVAEDNPHLYWEIYRYCGSFEAPVSDGDSSDGNEKVSKKSNFPRKRFPWTSEAKKAVCDIATVWRQYYKVRKPRKENMDSFVSTFMESKILPLWPKGWVTIETLLKYSTPETPGKRKLKKSKDNVQANNAQIVTNNCTSRLENTPSTNTNINNLNQQERSKTPTNLKSSSSLDNISYTSPSSQAVKSSEITTLAVTAVPAEKKQTNNTSKYKDKIREGSTPSSHLDNSVPAPIAKISVVPTSQLMAQKPKAHSDKFNPLNLTSSTVSITPVNDYQKANKLDEVKKDVVSITPFSDTAVEHGNVKVGFLVSNNSGSKSLPLKHRILNDNADKKIDDRDIIATVGVNTADSKDKKCDRWIEDKYKSSGDMKKRRKEIITMHLPQQSSSITKHEVSSILQPKLGLSQEEIDRQIEETEAATNFLSQIINEESPRSTSEGKRKEPSLIDDGLVYASTFPPSEQDKDVQMVMRSLKELQELQENKYSPSHSPFQKSKSSHQYVGFSSDYHQHYHNKKDDKLSKIPKDEPHWLSRD
ncbi:ubinuclein-2 isoform X1 [Cotesia glomerata]|uniref:Ubinuclein-1 n=1 Tax=Cotesia glomerata TaxID=32391 RepID=A0AAV7ID32_COTGL|nr:ubinuclein-2 isoform X1 [Cotesia glomerata]KAH0550195.1 hypothetical protein KQX54_017986 [Cotesia glomerata]